MPFSTVFQIPIDTRRVYGLDILRAFAIFAVLLTHSAGFLPARYTAFNNLITFDGVTIFFVLSGFLIGGILIKTLDEQKAGRRILLDFWLKRWIRTIPPYFLILTLVLLLNWNNPNIKFNYYKSFYVFLQNFYSPHPFFFQEAWSLSVEEWFYLLVPIAIFLLINLGVKSKRSVLCVAVVVLVLVSLYRYYKYLHFHIDSLGEWDISFRKIVITRLDSLMYGVIAAYLSYYASDRWKRYRKLQFIIGVLLLLLGKISPENDSYGLYSCVFSFSVTSLGTMLLLPFLMNIKKGQGFIYKAVTFTSLISYSLYLLNNTVVVIFITYPILNKLGALPGTRAYNLIGYTCFWIFSIVGSALMYRYFEVPVMSLRSHFLSKINKK